MTAHLRSCTGPEDFPAISDFIFTLYEPDNRDGNWFQPTFEYAYAHPWFADDSVAEIGIWEDDGAIVGVSTYELRLGEAFLLIHPEYAALRFEMLDHAEKHFVGTDKDGNRILHFFVRDFDTELEAAAADRGFTRLPGRDRPMTQIKITDPFLVPPVPEGFKIKSLADDNDLAKVDRCLHRGFNHPGEPPEDGIAGRQRMQSAPHFRHDLNIVVEAPTGDFVAYGGMWFDHVNKFGYVEPVATDPDYRRLGLGTAAVLESVRRCGGLGATVAYVGSTMPFYQQMGFEYLYTQNCWEKRFD